MITPWIDRQGINISRSRVSPLKAACVFALLLLLPSLACGLPLLGQEESTPGPTPPPDEILSFLAPDYRVTLNAGETVAGTQMTYVGRQGDVYNVSIDGLPAAKRMSDSFLWKGVIAQGVVAKYSLRLSPTFLSEGLLVAGPVELFVLNPAPVELENLPPEKPTRVHFSDINVELSAGKGTHVPGTSLVYEGVTEQGAELSGTRGYPYRALNDSLIWTGRLRGNVIVRYSLRTTEISDEHIQFEGKAELWVDLDR